MHLLSLAPLHVFDLCDLPVQGSPLGIVVGLNPRWRDWISKALGPQSHLARNQLHQALGLQPEQRQQLDQWLLAIDWLEQVPEGFEARLCDWLTCCWAEKLARHWGLPYLDQEEPQAGSSWVRAARKSSLASLAAHLGPERVSLWLEEPAFLTAEPQQVPEARWLRQLDSNCAQELARLRGLELDPLTLEELARQERVVEVGWLRQPHWPLTRIVSQHSSASAVLALVSSQEVQLLTLKSQRMFGRPGFLAQAFRQLASLNCSVDLLATSQASVTLTLDPGQRLGTEALALLEQRLECRIEVLDNCSCIHFVGNHLRGMLPQLGPALELFEEHPIHLVSQASSDVSLTLVVHQEQAERLLTPLHALLFGGGQESEIFGPTFQQLQAGGSKTARSQPSCWWMERVQELLALAPGYVYHLPTVEQRACEIESLQAIDRRFYALKANPHRQILATLVERGFGLECVSPGELERADLAGAQRLFTPNFVSPEEYQQAFADGCWVTLDNIDVLRRWPGVFAGREILLRLDSGAGSGHHKHVRTAGDSSKFGISAEHWPELRARLKDHQVTVLGLHSHAGSGITDAEHWVRTARFLYQAAEESFPEARVLNLGGGLGIPDRPGKHRLDFQRLQQSLQAFLQLHPGRSLWLEPGRYLVAEAGVLLARVTQIKQKGEKRYLGLELGMNALIRPALYGAYHPIVNLSRWQEPAAWKVDVVGPICESGDILGQDRWLPETEVGDVLLIDNAGAYGASMASNYNLRGEIAQKCLKSLTSLAQE